MAGLEIPGFLIGLSGVIPLVEKSLIIWQCLAEAKAFGSDMMGLSVQLSMESYRFFAWARVSGALQRNLNSQIDTSSLAPNPTSPNFPFSDGSSFRIEAPIEDAVARVAAILTDVAGIAEKYKQPDNASSTLAPGKMKPTSVALGLSSVLHIFGARHNPGLVSKLVQHREAVTALQDNTPFRLRFTFSSKPWGQSDKVTLGEKVKELCYWNDKLERLLPDIIRITLGSLVLPGQILVDENKEILSTLIKASTNQNESVRAHAMMWKERIEFTELEYTDTPPFNKYRRTSSVLDDVAGASPSRCGLSLKVFKEGHNREQKILHYMKTCLLTSAAPSLVTVEWYSYRSLNWTVDDARIATARIAELVHLSSRADRPKSLSVLEGLCFVEKSDSLGLVCQLPGNASPVKQPVSLYSLLRKDPEVVAGFRPPTLEQRLQLAQQLTSSVYSLGIVRWFHKDFNCYNIVFFRDNSASANILIDSPHVTGFSISRPDNENQKSLNKDLEALAIYLHPSLRVNDPKERPRYHRKFEMYSLGLVLFEIGIWNSIDHIAKSTLEPEKFKRTVIDRCMKDLAFFVGTKYRDIVLRCLTCADVEGNEASSSLDTMYWSIVLEIAKCR